MGNKGSKGTQNTQITSNHEIAFTIFQSEGLICNKTPNIIDGCGYLKRLITATIFYEKLDIINNQKDRQMFNNFILNIYQDQFLNDYNHLIKNHQYDLEEIYKQIHTHYKIHIHCNHIKNCRKSFRHNQRQYTEIEEQSNSDDIDSDDLLQFYALTMDSLHFYLFHLYDVGLRVMSNNNQQDEETKSDGLIDHNFSRIHNTIQDRRKTADTYFNRFEKATINKKFDLATNDTKTQSNVLFLDAMYDFISQRNKFGSFQVIEALMKYIVDEDFDTDSIKMDVTVWNGDKTGNIAANTTEIQVIEMLNDFIVSNESM